MPDMEKKIADLEAELALEKRKTAAYALYKAADAEGTVSINTFSGTSSECAAYSFRLAKLKLSFLTFADLCFEFECRINLATNYSCKN